MNANDIVIGSRYINGGVDSRGLCRKYMSKIVNLFIRIYLGTGVCDSTSGYRCFKKEVIENISFDKVFSEGPSIVEEILYICVKKGYKIKEVPIVFEERQKGESKLNIKKLFKVFFDILKIKRIWA